MAVKVMITDDHSLIREGLKQLLELEGDFQVIAEACDGIDCKIKRADTGCFVAGYQYAAHEWT